MNQRNHPLASKAIVGLTGLSYSRLFVIWIILAILFGLAYFKLSIIAPLHGPSPFEDMTVAEKFWNSFYYSIITATSTGYGDIVPHGFSKFLASTQSILALFVFAVFVTKLVSHRQETAIRQMHHLTYESIYNNIREGLFFIRKDFDRIIVELDSKTELTDKDWEDLVMAFRHGQILISEIPNFYEAGNEHLYTLDEDREYLLHAAVKRTLERLSQLISVLNDNNINWLDNGTMNRELTDFLKTVGKIMPLWKDRSPYERVEIFEYISNLHSEVEGCLTRPEKKED